MDVFVYRRLLANTVLYVLFVLFCFCFVSLGMEVATALWNGEQLLGGGLLCHVVT